VSLVAILDADKEGFLRSEGSLIQTIGRAARNVHGRAILYADVVTGSMRRAMDETERRRRRQVAFNAEHGITPVGIVKAVQDVMEGARSSEERGRRLEGGSVKDLSPEQVMKRIKKLEAEMMKLARNLEFEAATRSRTCAAPASASPAGGRADRPPGAPGPDRGIRRSGPAGGPSSFP